MLAYTVIGSNRKDEALAFYDALLSELGGTRAFANDRIQFYSGGSGAMLAVGTPANGEHAACGNGTMAALACGDTATVDRVHAKAVELGAENIESPNEGIPGVFYGGYFRDLDGNKICCAAFL